MTHPARVLLPCLLATLPMSVMAQQANGGQTLPSTVFQIQAEAPLQSPALARPSLVGAYVSPDQGFPGAVRATAAELRNNSAPIPGPAPARTLRLGDKGADVEWLVQALVARGFLDAPPTQEVLPGPVVAPSTTTTYTYPSGPAVTELYQAGAPDEMEFTAEVEQAVRSFQGAHGLSEDGVAGGEVYKTLTVDHTKLANALDAWADNLALWADQARAQGHQRMIVVNIPSYTLHAIDLGSNEEDLQSRVIVGRPYTPTPTMMTRVVNLKANPDWSPPKSIRGARYQRPGPNNALGLMRFSTDNNMSIYLHDTNARGLFANDARALSHGCVRVQQWHPLAAWVAQQDEQWVDEVALVGGKTRFLKVDAVPVVITYSLVDVVDGTARQFNDIYNRKERAIGAAALQGLPEPAARDWHQGR